MYANRKSVSGRYTSQGKVELPAYTKEYTYQKNHSGAVLLVGILIVVLLALFIVSHVGASAAHVTNYVLTGMLTGGECQAKGAQGDTFLSVNDASCQTTLGFGMKSYHSISEPMVQDATVDTESTPAERDNDDTQVETVVTVESSIVPADDTPAVSVPDEPKQDTPKEHIKDNNGHGNNVDGVDVSNPSDNTPHDKQDESAPVDDEKEHSK